jgi:hypothetical protein
MFRIAFELNGEPELAGLQGICVNEDERAILNEYLERSDEVICGIEANLFSVEGHLRSRGRLSRARDFSLEERAFFARAGSLLRSVRTASLADPATSGRLADQFEQLVNDLRNSDLMQAGRVRLSGHTRRIDLARAALNRMQAASTALRSFQERMANGQLEEAGAHAQAQRELLRAVQEMVFGVRDFISANETRNWPLRVLLIATCAVMSTYLIYRGVHLYTEAGYIWTSKISAALLYIGEMYYNLFGITMFAGIAYALFKTDGGVGYSWLPVSRQELPRDVQEREAVCVMPVSANTPPGAIWGNYFSKMKPIWHYGRARLLPVESSYLIFEDRGIEAVVNHCRAMSGMRYLAERVVRSVGVEPEASRLIANNLASEATEINDYECRQDAIKREVADIARRYNVDEKAVGLMSLDLAEQFMELNGRDADWMDNPIDFMAARRMCLRHGIPEHKAEVIARAISSALDSLVRQSNIAQEARAVFERGCVGRDPSQESRLVRLLVEEFGITTGQAHAIVTTLASQAEEIENLARALPAGDQFDVLRTREGRAGYRAVHAATERLMIYNERIGNTASRLQDRLRIIIEYESNLNYSRSRRMAVAVAQRIHALPKLLDEIERELESVPEIITRNKFAAAQRRVMDRRRQAIVNIVSEVGEQHGVRRGRLLQLAEAVADDVLGEGKTERDLAAYGITQRILFHLSDGKTADEAVTIMDTDENNFGKNGLGAGTYDLTLIDMGFSGRGRRAAIIGAFLGITNITDAGARQTFERGLQDDQGINPATAANIFDALAETRQFYIEPLYQAARILERAYRAVDPATGEGRVRKYADRECPGGGSLRTVIVTLPGGATTPMQIAVLAAREEIDFFIPMRSPIYEEWGAKAGRVNAVIKGYTLRGAVGEIQRGIIADAVVERRFGVRHVSSAIRNAIGRRICPLLPRGIDPRLCQAHILESIFVHHLADLRHGSYTRRWQVADAIMQGVWGIENPRAPEHQELRENLFKVLREMQMRLCETEFLLSEQLDPKNPERELGRIAREWHLLPREGAAILRHDREILDLMQRQLVVVSTNPDGSRSLRAHPAAWRDYNIEDIMLDKYNRFLRGEFDAAALERFGGKRDPVQTLRNEIALKIEDGAFEEYFLTDGTPQLRPGRTISHGLANQVTRVVRDTQIRMIYPEPRSPFQIADEIVASHRIPNVTTNMVPIGRDIRNVCGEIATAVASIPVAAKMQVDATWREITGAIRQEVDRVGNAVGTAIDKGKLSQRKYLGETPAQASPLYWFLHQVEDADFRSPKQLLTRVVNLMRQWRNFQMMGYRQKGRRSEDLPMKAAFESGADCYWSWTNIANSVAGTVFSWGSGLFYLGEASRRSGWYSVMDMHVGRLSDRRPDLAQHPARNAMER